MSAAVDSAHIASEGLTYRPLGRTPLRLSSLGFGASPLGDVFRATSTSESSAAVHLAIDSGINFFDVSPYYGETLAETRLGNALAGKRNTVLLATKCGRYGEDHFDFSAATITREFGESLRRLRTDHVDLLQAHDTEFTTVDQIVEETIPAMRRLQEQGKARYIGITGYSLANLLSISARCEVDSILSYCRYNLLIDDLALQLLPVAKVRCIGLINASPLHMGLLTESGPPAWHPAPESVKAAGRAMVQFCRENGVDAAGLAVRFSVENSAISSTLVGMSTRAEVQRNLRALREPFDRDFGMRVQALAGSAGNVVWNSGLPGNEG